MNFGLSFSNPLALLLFVPLAAYFVWLSRRTLADLSPGRNRLALGLRLILLALIVSALAGAQLVRYNRDLAVMFVVDYSDSVGPGAKQQAQSYIEAAVKERKPNDRWGVVVFGRDAYIDLAPGASPTLGKIQTVPPGEFTDIAAAIRLAIASLPDGMQKRLVVLSDGNENLGNAVAEAQIASNNEIAIDVAPLSSPQTHEVLLERLTLPNEAKIGEPLEIRAIARATQPTDAAIKLFRDGKYLGEKKVQLQRGKNVFVFPQSVEEAGSATFEAQIETRKGMDTVAENNRGLGFVSVAGKPRVLLVDNDSDQAKFLYNALRREKVNVELRGAGGLPTQLRQMQPYDAIILGNVPAWDLSVQQMQAMQSYVRDLGGGLVMVGGENSFGPGGYRSTPVEETLPVTMDIRNMQYLPGGAVAMIMHSMEFPDGNDWAKSVCSEVTRQMGDEDYAGLIIYGMSANWVYPMLKVGPNRNKMLTQIRSINPGDMPDFDAALEVAYTGLKKSPAYLKHCIILSDGDPSPPKPSLVAKFNAARITVSTVVINPHDNSGNVNMWRIAQQHGGRFYKVLNPKQIPKIFLKEAATVSRSAIIEGPFTPRLESGSSIIKGIDALPKLLGYVGTSAKPPSAGTRVVLSSAEGDPILATRQYGLGKSVAFTSDARQRWAAGWLGWSGFSKFWAQTVRWSMRQSSASDLQTAVDIDRGIGRITIEAVDEKGNFLNFLNPKARLVPPNMKGQDITLEQTGPGRYEATFDARELGTYLVNIRTQRGDQIRSQITGGVLPYSPEYNSVGTNQLLMTQIAETSGGEEVQSNQIFARERKPARLPQDIWLPLLMVAACLFPLDVAARRLMWGEDEIAGAKRTWRNRFTRTGSNDKTGGGKTVIAPRDAGMDRLLKTKGRAASPEAPPAQSASTPSPP
ncbi:MAG TPA: VWA domain-containing protein, partial [Abditibacteriaceae bacterium]